MSRPYTSRDGWTDGDTKAAATAVMSPYPSLLQPLYTIRLDRGLYSSLRAPRAGRDEWDSCRESGDMNSFRVPRRLLGSGQGGT